MSNWPVPEISGTNVVIRPVQDSDKDQRAAIPRYPELVRLYGGNSDSHAPSQLTQDEVQGSYSRHLAHPQEIRWVIEVSGLIGRGKQLGRLTIAARNCTLD